MKPLTIVSCIAIIGLGALSLTEARAEGARQPGTRDPGVNRRQHNQAGRIGQGVKSGQLTREETKGLVEQQKSIRQKESEYKSDGSLTRDERKDLQQDLNEASKNIYQEKHDSETRPGVTPAEPHKPGTRDPGINARQHEQELRIMHGIRSGELTWAEAKGLVGRERFIAMLEHKLKEDGSLTLRERARLQKLLNELSADIYREKHDGERR